MSERAPDHDEVLARKEGRILTPEEREEYKRWMSERQHRAHDPEPEEEED